MVRNISSNISCGNCIYYPYRCPYPDKIIGSMGGVYYLESETGVYHDYFLFLLALYCTEFKAVSLNCTASSPVEDMKKRLKMVRELQKTENERLGR